MAEGNSAGAQPPWAAGRENSEAGKKNRKTLQEESRSAAMAEASHEREATTYQRGRNTSALENTSTIKSNN